MNYEDVLLNVAVSNSTTDRTYTKYAIEYDSDEPLSELLTDDATTLSAYVDDALIRDKVGAESTYTDSGGTEQAFTRRVLVSDTEARDAIEGECSTREIPYETRDIAPTAKQRYLIERANARNTTEVEDAIEAKGTLLDRDLVTDDTKAPIAEAINQMGSNDPELAGALDNVFEVMTGETSDELLERIADTSDTDA